MGEKNTENTAGERIRKCRHEKLMTQSELAGDQISRNMLSLIEHGNSEPSIATLRYLAGRLNVSPAFLLSDDSEEKMFRRHARIRDIRIAYRAKEYEICRDLCRAVGDPEDDELNLLIGECSIGLAIDAIGEGKLRQVGELLESAVSAASGTVYPTAHLYAEASVLAHYLRRFSESLYSDVESAAEHAGIPLLFAAENDFCAYLLLLFHFDKTENLSLSSAEEYETVEKRLRESAPALTCHIDALRLFRDGNPAEALECFEALLSMNDPLPKPLLYEIFRDREICARDVGDYKCAYESAGAKNDLLVRILSDA